MTTISFKKFELLRRSQHKELQFHITYDNVKFLVIMRMSNTVLRQLLNLFNIYYEYENNKSINIFVNFDVFDSPKLRKLYDIVSVSIYMTCYHLEELIYIIKALKSKHVQLYSADPLFCCLNSYRPYRICFIPCYGSRHYECEIPAYIIENLLDNNS